MPRPGYVVGWMAATAAAVGIAYAGVSSVAGGVVEPLTPTAGLPAVSTPEPEPAPSEPAPSQPVPSPTTSTPVPTAGEVRSYALVGGSATLRYGPGRVTVVTAEPRQGFTVEVEGDGTAEVRVEFDSEEHRSRLRGAWEGGPRDRVEEDDDRDDDGDD